MNLTQLSSTQPRRAADLTEKLATLRAEFAGILGASASVNAPAPVHHTQTASFRAQNSRRMKRLWRKRKAQRHL